MATQTLEGTWEEITRHAKEFAGRKVRITVLDEENAANGDLKKRRQAGSAEGLIKMSDDFDAPLEGFEEYQP